jgi:hypothetical protein
MGPTSALIGEAGPELVLPLQSASTHRLLAGIAPQITAAIQRDPTLRGAMGGTTINEYYSFQSLVFDERTLRDFERKRQGVARRDQARFVSRRAGV